MTANKREALQDGGETQRFAETQKKRLWERRGGKVGRGREWGRRREWRETGSTAPGE